MHYWDLPEYWEESLRLVETYCNLNSSERPSANADVKKISQGANNYNHSNYLDLGKELNKLEHENYADTNCNCMNTKGLVQRLVDLERTSGDHQNYGIFEISQHTEKSPGYSWKHISQTPVKNYWVTLVWKTLKRV